MNIYCLIALLLLIFLLIFTFVTDNIRLKKDKFKRSIHSEGFQNQQSILNTDKPYDQLILLHLLKLMEITIYTQR